MYAGKKRCPICRREVPCLFYRMLDSVDRILVRRMENEFPDWSLHDGICLSCLDRYKRMNAPEYIDVYLN